MTINYRRDLPALMRELNLPMIAVMLGVAEGLDSLDLLVNGIQKLYMVDAWKSYENMFGDVSNFQNWHDRNYGIAMDKIRGYEHKCVVLRGLTDEMAPSVPNESVGMVYVDANHTREWVLKDINNYLPKLVPGGIMAFHDYENPSYEVGEAVREYCEGKYDIIPIPEDKMEDAGCYFIKK